METPAIREFYANKNVFITGGSGFIGKVLIEKLLRSSPELGTVYVLLRPKKGKSLEERIKIITDLPLFDLLRSQNPAALKKIKPIKGDVCEIGLGLSEEDKGTLINEVDIIFHGAASIRFDDALSQAIILNTRGTREVALLAQQMEHLLIMVHLSTAYCHTDRDVIDECLYPPHADWRDTIKLAETLDSYTLDVLSAKYIDKHPNTYTFTKSLSEHVVNDLCKEKEIPLVIVRPSIVAPSLKEPMPGWIDNLHGPCGLTTAIATGLLHSTYGDPDVKLNCMTVDLVTKIVIAATWEKCLEKDPVKKLQSSVYNATSHSEIWSLYEIIHSGLIVRDTITSKFAIWYPDVTITKCRYNHFLKLILYHVLPALVVDGVLRIVKRKPILLKIQRKIYIANLALAYFMSKEWQFGNANAQQLQRNLKKEDVKDFAAYDVPINIITYVKNGLLGGAKYILHEEIDESETDGRRRKNSGLRLLSQFCNVLWYVGLVYVLFYKMDVLGWLSKCMVDVYTYFITE